MPIKIDASKIKPELFLEPQGAYILFANIVKTGIVKNIFTTNFDDMINDALLSYSCIKPRVYAHNETASYINIEDEKPNVIKLHGDYLFNNMGDDAKFYENIEIALKKGYPIEEFIETDEVYNKYKDKDRFQELLKKYSKKP